MLLESEYLRVLSTIYNQLYERTRKYSDSNNILVDQVEYAIPTEFPMVNQMADDITSQLGQLSDDREKYVEEQLKLLHCLYDYKRLTYQPKHLTNNIKIVYERRSFESIYNNIIAAMKFWNQKIKVAKKFVVKKKNVLNSQIVEEIISPRMHFM